MDTRASLDAQAAVKTLLDVLWEIDSSMHYAADFDRETWAVLEKLGLVWSGGVSAHVTALGKSVLRQPGEST